MDLSTYSIRDLQTTSSLLAAAEKKGIGISVLSSSISNEISARTQPIRIADAAKSQDRKRATNTCPLCGSPAVVVPLAKADRSPTATHALQCQNRPATDSPWRDGMCGHTEYIVRGGR